VVATAADVTADDELAARLLDDQGAPGPVDERPLPVVADRPEPDRHRQGLDPVLPVGLTRVGLRVHGIGHRRLREPERGRQVFARGAVVHEGR
jgi:hypothetical protein